MIRGRLELDADRPSVDVAQVLEAVLKRANTRSRTRHDRQNTDARDRCYDLRPGGGRRGEEAKCDAGDEGSPVHYSIT